ncbi:MAG TPA: ABC transporter permease [Anaerolineales bacterium]|nr:ABC transporter permease [Anaerolineae bacterium]HIP87980.1 ABC transporter permease [Anaerolineales bacterium]
MAIVAATGERDRWRRTVQRYLGLTLNVFPPFIYLLLLFYAPMAILLVMSFWKSGFMHLEPAFTLENYRTFLTSPIHRRVLLNTFLTATGAMAGLVVIGYPIAYFLARMVHKYDTLLIYLLIIPVEINYLIRIYAWKIILGRSGVINSLLMGLGLIDGPLRFLLYSRTAVVIVLIHEWLPYVVIPIYVALKGIPPEVPEAARDLGAGRWGVFRHVLLPLSVPGLFASFILVYIPMLGEFAVPTLVGGPGGYMLGNVIESQFLSAGNWGLGAAIGFVLLFVTIVLVAVVIKVAGVEELM